MTRPKGSKNKPKEPVVEMPSGNPTFNLNDTDVAMSAVTAEDLAFERELERMALEQPPIEAGPAITFKKEIEHRELLSEHVEDYSPASTVNELENQVHMAKELGCDSIEGTPALIKTYCRSHYPDDVGYFIFKNVKVYIAGFFEQSKSKAKANDSIEQKLFGHSKIVGQPIMVSEKK